MSLAASELKQILQAVEQAAANGELTGDSVENVTAWLSDQRYAEYAEEVAQHVRDGRWRELNDAFYTEIPFGTGGRRGRMYPIGSNTINDRTIGESAQGLAEYVLSQGGDGPLSCAIAYDTRHRSPEFSRLCAEIMVAHGFTVYFLDDFRSTPELSFLVRFRGCSCGIMVTASHNPPSDNAVKIYWSNGAQVLPPHDGGIIDQVKNVGALKRADFDAAVQDGRVVICTKETDQAYLRAIEGLARKQPRTLSVLYSPLHGVGAASVVPALTAAGFDSVTVFPPHAKPDGDFPNVVDNTSNPENPRVFDGMIELAKETGCELALATDPDCDRMGCATLVQWDASDWATLTGNQVAALLTDYVLERARDQGRLRPESFVVTTLVSTAMMRRVAESYGAQCYDNLLVGFKWICSEMDRRGPELFLFGAEESYGYLAGDHARDKDGAVACMLLAELADKLKSEGRTLHEKLEALFFQHGCHEERTLNIRLEGAAGAEKTRELMKRFRSQPPAELAGIPVAGVRDYLHQTHTPYGGQAQPLDGPKGDLVMLDLAEEGNYVAVRPSGTEPKVKLYMFAFKPAELLGDLAEDQQQLRDRLDQIGADLSEFAKV